MSPVAKGFAFYLVFLSKQREAAIAASFETSKAFTKISIPPLIWKEMSSNCRFFIKTLTAVAATHFAPSRNISGSRSPTPISGK